MKLIKIDFKAYSNELLVRYMHQLCLTGKFNEDKGNLNFKTCSNFALCRNIYIRGKVEANFSGEKILNDNLIYSDILSESHRYNSYYSKKSFMNFETFLSTASVDQTMVNPVDNIVEKSWNMFNNRSFLHKYEQHGVDREVFINAFVHTEQLLHSLKKLSPNQ